MLSADALAEDLYAHLPPAPGVVREERGYAVLDASAWPDPIFSHAIRLREPDVEAVRDWFRGNGREDFTWWLGPSTRPAGLRVRLRAGGAEPYEELEAMTVAREPPDVPGVDVGPVESFEDYLVAQEVSWAAWDSPEEQRRLQRETAPERWRARSRTQQSFLAYLDGRPAGRAGAVFTPAGAALTGGAVVPWARGRGAYRALVRARWDAAVARGTPLLAVQAMPSSQPILARLGFETVCTVELLRDRT